MINLRYVYTASQQTCQNVDHFENFFHHKFSSSNLGQGFNICFCFCGMDAIVEYTDCSYVKINFTLKFICDIFAHQFSNMFWEFNMYFGIFFFNDYALLYLLSMAISTACSILKSACLQFSKNRCITCNYCITVSTAMF